MHERHKEASVAPFHHTTWCLNMVVTVFADTNDCAIYIPAFVSRGSVQEHVDQPWDVEVCWHDMLGLELRVCGINALSDVVPLLHKCWVRSVQYESSLLILHIFWTLDTYSTSTTKLYKLCCSPESKAMGVRKETAKSSKSIWISCSYSHLVIPAIVIEIFHSQWRRLWIWCAGAVLFS